MKKFIKLILFLSFIANSKSVLCQKAARVKPFEISVGLGSFAAPSAPSALEFVQPISSQIEFSRNFRISKTGNQWLQAGISMQSISAVTDHYFKQGLSKVEFVPLPVNLNYNLYRQTQLQLPISFKQVLFSKEDKGISLNVGVVPGYIISSSNRLRGNGQKTNVSQMPENRFHWSGRMEFSTINLKMNKSSLIWGAGLQYQFSEFLNNQQSFKPLIMYFKIGMNL